MLVGVMLVVFVGVGIVIANPNFSTENRTEAKGKAKAAAEAKAAKTGQAIEKTKERMAAGKEVSDVQAKAAKASIPSSGSTTGNSSNSNTTVTTSTTTNSTTKSTGKKKCSDSAGNQISAGTIVIGPSDVLYECGKTKDGSWGECADCKLTDKNVMLPESYKTGTINTNKDGKKEVVNLPAVGKKKCMDGNNVYQSGDIIDDATQTTCGSDGKMTTNATAYKAAVAAEKGTAEVTPIPTLNITPRVTINPTNLSRGDCVGEGIEWSSEEDRCISTWIPVETPYVTPRPIATATIYPTATPAPKTRFDNCPTASRGVKEGCPEPGVLNTSCQCMFGIGQTPSDKVTISSACKDKGGVSQRSYDSSNCESGWRRVRYHCNGDSGVQASSPCYGPDVVNISIALNNLPVTTLK